MISEGTTAAIFSLESEDGNSPCSSRGGKGQSGQAPARASRSASQAKAQGKRTSDTCGPLFTASSPSADLQRSLVSKLQAQADCSGSPEYALTWREVDMPWGPPICRLRASGLRTFDSGFGGWPTPDAGGFNQTETLESFEARREKLKAKGINGNGAGRLLGIAAQMAGWPTPRSADADKGVRTPIGCMAEYARRPTGHDLNTAAVIAGWATPRVATNGGNGNPERAADGKARLEDQVHGWPTPNATDGSKAPKQFAGGNPSLPTAAGQHAGWATPSARDHKSEAGLGHDARMAETRGQPLSRQTATTGGRGALAPAFVRWLMGFPAGWENFADSATPSCPR